MRLTKYSDEFIGELKFLKINLVTDLLYKHLTGNNK